MQKLKIAGGETVRLFRHPLLERLSRTSFIVPVIFFYAGTACCLFLYANTPGAAWHALWLFPAGMFAFTLAEYLIHRFIFHFNAHTEKQLDLQYHMHGVHHEFPRDKNRLAMPLLMSMTIASLFFVLFRLLLGDSGFVFFAGFIFGYSTYLIIHFAVHALKPPDNFLKYYWKHHSLHHYASDKVAFSVSMPLWDIIFGTMPQHAGQKKPAALHS